MVFSDHVIFEYVFFKFWCPSRHTFCLFFNDTGGRESELGTLISKFNIRRSYPFIRPE